MENREDRKDAVKKMVMFKGHMCCMLDETQEYREVSRRYYELVDDTDGGWMLFTGILDAVVGLLGAFGLACRYCLAYAPSYMTEGITAFYNRFLSIGIVPYVMVGFAAVHYLVTFILEHRRCQKVQEEIHRLGVRMGELNEKLHNHYLEYQDPPVSYAYSLPDTLNLIIGIMEKNDEISAEGAIQMLKDHDWLRESRS